MDLPTAIEKYWSHAVALAAGAFAAWKATREMREKRRTDAIAAAAAEHAAKLDLQKLAQDAVEFATRVLREEIDRLSGELEVLRAEMRETHRLMADKDAKIALLEGRERQLLAEIAILRRQLVDAGMTPRVGLHVLEVPAGDQPKAEPVTTEPLS